MAKRTSSGPTSGKRLRLEYRDAAELADNPANWRKHPEAQIGALEGILAEVGWAGALLYNERTGRLIDGHARKKVAKGQVPVLVGDWSEEEERKILATLDPLAMMAEADKGCLDALLSGLTFEAPGLKDLIGDLLGATPDVPEDAGRVKPLDVAREPPGMSWVLIGIPTIRFGEIAADVERIAGIEGVCVETTSNEKYLAATG